MKDAIDASPSKEGKQNSRSHSQLLWNSAILASIVGALGLGAGIVSGDIKVDELDDLLKRASLEIRGLSAEAIKHLPFGGF